MSGKTGWEPNISSFGSIISHLIIRPLRLLYHPYLSLLFFGRAPYAEPCGFPLPPPSPPLWPRLLPLNEDFFPMFINTTLSSWQGVLLWSFICSMYRNCEEKLHVNQLKVTLFHRHWQLTWQARKCFWPGTSDRRIPLVSSLKKHSTKWWG